MMVKIPKELRTDGQAPPREPRPFYNVFCPCCGLQRGVRRDRGIFRTAWALLPSQRRHFGIVQISRGRGKIETVGYFSPGEDPYGLFEQVKEQFLAGLGSWYEKGWITNADLEALKEPA